MAFHDVEQFPSAEGKILIHFEPISEPGETRVEKQGIKRYFKVSAKMTIPAADNLINSHNQKLITKFQSKARLRYYLGNFPTLNDFLVHGILLKITI